MQLWDTHTHTFMIGTQLPRNNLCHLTKEGQRPQTWQNVLMAFPGQRSEPAGCTEVNKAWRRAMEGSHWTELLVRNTTAPQWGGKKKNGHSKRASLLVTVQHSAAQDFQLETLMKSPWHVRQQLSMWFLFVYGHICQISCVKHNSTHQYIWDLSNINIYYVEES